MKIIVDFFKKFHKTFFSKELPIELILFNIITIMGCVGGLITLPISFTLNTSWIQLLSIFVAVVVDVACIFLANAKNQLRNATISICFVVAIVLFPIMFFTGGGINSGMVCWFSLGMIFIFMLLDGMDFFFMLLTDMAVIFGCYIVSYYHPEYVIPLGYKYALYLDVMQSLLVSSIAIGIIVKFQVSIYSKLYAAAEINNDDLLEKTLAAKRAEHQAQSATEAKSNFLANMSHEIRTPINTILGMDEMILRETGEKKIADYAIDIKSASQTLLSLINDILDITKIESGKMTIIEGEYQFMSLMHDVLNGANLRAKEKGLTLSMDVDSDIPSALIGDDIRIKQVLTNIITNAVKYTHEGSIDINITCEKNLDDSVDLTFAVKDTGIGIKQEDIKKLFDSFERLEVSRNRNIEGAGLGMAITQNILKLMDSYLKVDSVYGEGSVFSFTLNQVVANPEPIGDFNDRMAHMSSSYEYATSFEAPKAKFLIVDDNAMNRKVFVALLKESKVQVVEAEDGQTCLTLIKQQHFDMIFLDHMMPGLDGVETFKAMQHLENNLCLGTPVIVLTANAVAGAKERYLTMGFHGFLSKPIVPAQLEKMIRDFLPENLLEYHIKSEADEKRENRVEEVNLPVIEGIEWEYALLHFPEENMVRQSAIDFYESIGNEREELLGLYSGFNDNEPPIEDYRIKIHGIKSMANTIGATTLGALAKLLEYAARDGETEKIQMLTPLFIEELDALTDRMSVMGLNDSKPQLEDPDVLFAMLEMLKMALKTHNSGQYDSIMSQITSYSYEEDVQNQIDHIKQHITNFEEEDAIEDIEKMQE